MSVLRLRVVLACCLVSLSVGSATADTASMAAAFGMDEVVMAASDAGSGADSGAQGEAFAQGTWAMQGYGSATFGVPEGELYNASIGVGYHLLDGLSLNAEVLFGGIDSDREGALAFGGIDLLVRYHDVRLVARFCGRLAECRQADH